MTNQEAQQLITSYMEDWFNNIGPDFIEDSIRGGVDEETKTALEQVGLNFNWEVKVTA